MRLSGAQRQPNPAPGYGDAEDRCHARPGLLVTDVYPVLAVISTSRSLSQLDLLRQRHGRQESSLQGYLIDVSKRIGDHPVNALDELLPINGKPTEPWPTNTLPLTRPIAE